MLWCYRTPACIGVNNNNLNGASEGAGTGTFAGTTITSGDESFIVNPETVVDSVTVFIDNSVSGYNPATEDLFYTVYYTDGTVSGPTDVTAAMLLLPVGSPKAVCRSTSTAALSRSTQSSSRWARAPSRFR